MRIREIDGIRAFAVMAVVATHYLNWIPYSGAQFGWLGVDLFFVLSGFLDNSGRGFVAGGFDAKNQHGRITVSYFVAGAPPPRPTAARFDRSRRWLAMTFRLVQGSDRHAQRISTCSAPKTCFSDSVYGGLQIPRSVMMPAMKRCGVMSNAGFQISAPSGVS